MNRPTRSRAVADRPRVRIEPPRRALPTDLHHHHADRWPPIEAGKPVTLWVGWGLTLDLDEVGPLARRLRRASRIRIAARTEAAARGARDALTALWRAEDLGQVI